jgi:hypothetical protein
MHIIQFLKLPLLTVTICLLAIAPIAQFVDKAWKFGKNSEIVDDVVM